MAGAHAHETLQRRLKARGVRPSSQRLAIAEYVLHTTEHPTADDVFRRVTERHPAVSRATVYNTLQTFVVSGLLRTLVVSEGRIAYDPNVVEVVDADPGASGVTIQPGDRPDVLVAMNPAALKVNIGDLRPNGLLVVNADAFKKNDLRKAAKQDPEYKPFLDKALSDLRRARNRTEQVEVRAISDGVIKPMVKKRAKVKQDDVLAKVQEAEAQVPLALSEALRSGNLGAMDYFNLRNLVADTDMRSRIGSAPDDVPE